MCRVTLRPFLLVGIALGFLVGCDKTPTAPERHGIPQVIIVCDSAPSGDVTVCRAPVGCSLYPCAAGTPTDVTFIGVWSVDDASVARIISPGAVQSATRSCA